MHICIAFAFGLIFSESNIMCVPVSD